MVRNISLRVDDEVYEELNKLVAVYGVSKNTVLCSLIRQEYNRYDSDPKVKMAFEQLNELKETLARIDENLKSVK